MRSVLLITWPLLTLFATSSYATTEPLLPKWEKLPIWADDQGPLEREHAQFFTLPSRPHEIFSFGGLDFSQPQKNLQELWSYNTQNQKWTSISQAGELPPSTSRLAFNSQRQKLFAIGDSKNPHLYQLHLSESASWSKASLTGKITGTSFGAFIYDSIQDILVSFGGMFQSLLSAKAVNAVSFVLPQAETLEAQTGALQGSPEGRYGFPYAYDSKNQRLILASGQLNALKLGNQTVWLQDNQTWVLDLKAMEWKKLKTELPGRRNPCWAVDTKRNHLYVSGGTENGLDALEGLYRLDLNELEPEWILVETSGEPMPARASCSGTYDPAGDQLIFGFGNTLDKTHTQLEVFIDLWALKLSPSTGKSPAEPPVESPAECQ